MSNQVLEIALEKFREKYDSTRVTVYPNFLVYNTERGFSGEGVKSANKVIAILGVDLIAVETKFLSKDSFTVTAIWEEL